LYVGGANPQGTLWIVSAGEGHFDSGHTRVMMELAAFAGIALRMLGTEEQLRQALQRQEQLTVEQETLTKEMGHRIKNLFSIVGGMIRVSARNAATPGDMSKVLSDRLAALAAAHAVVRRAFDDKGVARQGCQLEEIVRTILRPHTGPWVFGQDRVKIDGPPILLGDHATNSFALVLHELATNAAKYGALKADAGSMQVRWRNKDGRLVVTWQEGGGPAICGEPTTQGFGGVLSKNAVVGQLGGTLRYDWKPTGLLVTISVPADRLSH